MELIQQEILGGHNHSCYEIWNGTTWTEVHELNTAEMVGYQDILTAALLLVVHTQVLLQENLEWTHWTEVADLNTAEIELEDQDFYS